MKYSKNINWVWTPAVGVGPFRYGEHIAAMEAEFCLEPVIDKCDSNWDEYRVKGSDNSIYTEHGLIVSVSCDDMFVFEGTNLIGISEEELISIFKGINYCIGTGVEYDDNSVQYPFEYDELGLMVWTEDGRVVSASAIDPSDD